MSFYDFKKILRKKLNQTNEKISTLILPILKIDDADNVYYRIDPMYFKPNGQISSGAYNRPEMSVNLERLTTVNKTLKGYAEKGFGVVSLPVGPLRYNHSQKVGHKPVICNYAHSLVIGQKTTPIKQGIQELGQKNILVPPRQNSR